MSWFQQLFSTGASDLIKTVGDTVDKFVTTDKEKMELNNSMQKAEQEYRLEMAKTDIQMTTAEEQNVTDRWRADMSSDNFLSKNARPLVLLVFTGLIVIMAIGGHWLKVDDGMTDMVQTVALMIYGAYFGGRSVEKVQHIRRKKM